MTSFQCVTRSLVGSFSSMCRMSNGSIFEGAQQGLGMRSALFCFWDLRCIRLCNREWSLAGLYLGGHLPMHMWASKLVGCWMNSNSGISLSSTLMDVLQHRNFFDPDLFVRQSVRPDCWFVWYELYSDLLK